MRATIWLIVPLVLLALGLVDILVGTVAISPRAVLNILLGQEANSIHERIVIQSRLPATLTAMLAGGALAVSGLLMQTFFRNPVAGPFILGVSGGAGLGVALVIMGSSALGLSLAPGGGAVALAASGGAVALLLLVLALSVRLRDMMTLLIIGILFGSACNAAVSVLQYLSDQDALRNYVFWTMGSLSGVTWSELGLLGSLAFAGLFLAVGQTRWLNALLFGEDYAHSVGVPLRTARLGILLAAGILAGSITAFCGPIAFVGVMVPHLARALLQRSNHATLLPMSFLLGAGLLVICHSLSRLPGAGYLLPVNAVTSLVGAPVVILILLRHRQVNRFF